jgi:hypothetical protein
MREKVEGRKRTRQQREGYYKDKEREAETGIRAIKELSRERERRRGSAKEREGVERERTWKEQKKNWK